MAADESATPATAGTGDHPVDPSAVVSRLRTTRARLHEDGPPPGRAWCDAWTVAVDEAVRDLWHSAPTNGSVTAVAVGGYGRRELCPGSDVDLLVLHDGLDPEVVDEVARAVFHPLWDAGLKLGHAVRSSRQLVKDALDELDTATAVIDGRVVAGEPERFDQGRTVLLDKLTGRRSYVQLLTDADHDRRARAGDAAEQLEPDVKNGAGGLRDVQSLRWAAAALTGEPTLEALASEGHIGVHDAERLRAAEDELLALRVALHLTTGTPVDVLRFEHQQEVAARLGEVDGAAAHDTAAHRALTRHFLAARTVEHVHDRAWRRIDGALARPWRRWRPAGEEVVQGLTVVDGSIRLPDDVSPLDEGVPAAVIRALLAGDHVLDRHTATRLRESAPDLPIPDVWGEDLRDAVRAMLWSGDDIVRVTAELDDVDWLVALLPEWAPLRGRPQRNPYHLYSLDRHAVHAVAELGELVRREAWAKDALVDVREGGELSEQEALDVVALACLVHDAGKAHGEPHSETGVPVAEAVGRRFGLGEEAITRLTWMVRQHLLLPDVGTRRDVSDPAEARAVAEEVGNRSRLASLWLLTAADSAATGPSAWTSWRRQLVRILVTKVLAVLDERDPAALHDGAAATAESAAELAEQMGATTAQVQAHLAQMPERYAAAVSPRAVVRHAMLADPPPEATEIRTRVTPGEPLEDGQAFDELDVVARDTPGLFAKVAGVLSLHGASVLEAHAHTRDDGTAVDTFTIVLPEHATPSWWVTVEGDLVEAVAGRIAVRARVARKRATEHRRLAKLPPVATEVTTSPDAAGRATLVEVRTMDRVGVLYRIASALAELELDLVVAKVGTFGHEAHDVFTVRDTAGGPLDADHCAELELAIRAALAE